MQEVFCSSGEVNVVVKNKFILEFGFGVLISVEEVVFVIYQSQDLNIEMCDFV